jgi:hypothetical protein
MGARAVVRSGKTSAIQEVKSGMSYLSQGALELHFGLGDRPSADAVEIRWPSGAREVLDGRLSGRILVLEGRGALRENLESILRANMSLP